MEFDLNKKSIIGKDLFDFFRFFPNEKVFQVCLNKWQNDPGIYPFYADYLKKSNKAIETSKLLFEALKKSKQFFEFICSLENRESFEFVFKNVTSKEIPFLLSNIFKFKSHKEFIVHTIIRVLSVSEFDKYFDEKDLDEEQSKFQLKYHFAMSNEFIIKQLLLRSYNTLKSRYLLDKINTEKLLEFRDKEKNNIFWLLYASKLDHLILIILKKIDKTNQDLKTKVQSLFQETNSEGVCISEYLLSAQNKVFFEYLNGYFEDKIFENFRFIEAEVVESELSKLENTPGKDIESFLEFEKLFGNVEKSIGSDLKSMFKFFKDANSLAFVEQKRPKWFEAEFIDTEIRFEAMMSDLIKETILAVDMEYYKAPNHSSTDCNYFYLQFYINFQKKKLH